MVSGYAFLSLVEFPSTKRLPVTVSPTRCSSFTGRTQVNCGAFEEVDSGHRNEEHSCSGYELVMGGCGGERTQW